MSGMAKDEFVAVIGEHDGRKGMLPKFDAPAVLVVEPESVASSTSQEKHIDTLG